MAHEPAVSEIVTLDEFTVAGLAHRGPEEEDLERLWMDFNERVDDLANVTAADEAYGVVYEYDAADDSFTYLAGVPVDDPGKLSPELTVVEIPAATYAVLDTSMAEVADLMDRITDEWTPDDEYERVEGPTFERYAADYDPTDADAPFEFYVPVSDEGDEY